MRRPHASETFFLPQRPYCTLGTLREQLLYPNKVHSSTTERRIAIPTSEELLEILRKVRLGDLAAQVAKSKVDSRESDDDAGDSAEEAEAFGNDFAVKGLDIVRDWSTMLSLGYQHPSDTEYVVFLLPSRQSLRIHDFFFASHREQQRLAFGRLLVNKPAFVILDEVKASLVHDCDTLLHHSAFYARIFI